MRSVPPASSAFFLVPQKEERGRAEAADAEQKKDVLDKVRVNHQRKAAEYWLPEVHPFPVHECDRSDRAEDQTSDEIGHVEIEHIDLSS